MNQYMLEAWSAGWRRFAIVAIVLIGAAAAVCVFAGHTVIVLLALGLGLTVAAAPFWTAGLLRGGGNDQTLGRGSEQAERCARESAARQEAWLKGKRYKSETPLQ